MRKDSDSDKEQVTASTSSFPAGESKETNASGKRKDKEEESSTKTVPLYKLFSFADSVDILLMFVGTIAAMGNGLCQPILVLLWGKIANAFGEHANLQQVLHEVSKVSLSFVYFAILLGLLGFLQITCWIVTGERQAARIRSLYLKTILRQDIGFYDTEAQTGEIIQRLSGDTVLIQDAMGEKVGKLIQLIVAFIGGYVVAFIKGWLLTLVMLCSIPALFLGGAVMSIFVTKLASQGQTDSSVASTVAEQTFGSIRTVASFTGEKQAVAKYNKSLTKVYKSGVKEGLATGFGFGTFDLTTHCSFALAVWFGGKMILHNGYAGGDVISILFASMLGSASLGQTAPCISAIAAGRAAGYKLFEIIERKPQIDSYDPNGVTLDDIRGDIELKDIYFSYPSRPHEQIFNGFSLSIPSGKTAALVGQSGSGKSTVISLIERFYDPQAGEVLIDGINLKNFQLRWIRQKIGLVSQEPVLFTSSIKDNIAYGNNGATIEEIMAAAELANAAKFIDKLPQGLDTMVGEHGTQLSGGQKQRIAIARAILKDPRILLLDEATSALDAESERTVQEALDKIMINRTTVIVAHRLSTVRNADTIAVIHRGKLIEKGTHSELTKDPDGAYSQLIKMQDMSRESKQNVVTDQDKSEIVLDSARRPSHSHRPSLLNFLSWGSPGIGSSSPHSFPAPLSSPSGISLPGAQPAEPYTSSASEKSKPLPKVPLRRLAFLNKPEIPVLLLGTIAAAIVGATLPIQGVIIASAIKSFYEPEKELLKDTRFWSLMYTTLGITCLLVHTLKSYFFAVAGCKLIKRIRSMCFEKLIHMEISWFDEAEHSSGAISARLSTDSSSIRSIVGDALGLIVQNAASLVGGLIIAFVANWQLALIVFALLPVVGLSAYLLMKSTQGFSADSMKIYAEASQVANDAVGSIRTVASFCAEDKVIELYQKKYEGPVKAGIRQGMIGGSAFGISFLMMYCAYALIFYVGGRFVEAGKTTFSDVFRVFFALTFAAMAVSQSGIFSTDTSKAQSAVVSIFGILDRKSEIGSNDESGMTIENIKGDIEFHHVSFRYPTRPDIQIFRDLCFAIRSGKTVALVGESGSGKSTVISLLQRFYDPDSGHITLDGIEIQKLQIKWLRQQMGLVSQEPVLFNDTIRANIAYGKEGNATEAEILGAAELANAHKFISSSKQGYDTMVGERGIQLSGGQKQRVAIARAVLKAPKIFLLDEATSALDTESERVVQEALDRVMVGRTTVVVAHRLSTIKGADLIAVVKNGVIVENGKHETLMSIRNGVYASLVALHTSAASS
ncbi:ABC transporter B family protein [Melia azedarach]|uniref:ABC transporter B family protein n=1 Tax=Melia azedarach TaxID=155640 RepID=A0ACC1YNT6_MELAZ|nr:ABC transporter B family protein [Melia azedarach]